MLEVFVLLAIGTCLAIIIQQNTIANLVDGIIENERIGTAHLVFVVLSMYLIWFSGTRTVMNDTSNYLIGFANSVPDSFSEMNTEYLTLSANPVLNIYMVLVKKIFNVKGQGFIFITACIVVVSMLRFLHKYSTNFGFSFYLFISFTVFAFSMAALKQTLATAIAIWSIPNFIKRKNIRGILIILFAALIHKYVIVLLVALVLKNKGIWNRTIVFSIILTVIAGVFYSEIVVRGALSVVDLVKANRYDESWFIEGTGVQVFRVLFYMIVPVLSFASRDELIKETDPMQMISINMSIIAMCFSIISSFGGAETIGRLPNYYDIFICISLPLTIKTFCKQREISENTAAGLIMIAFIVFYFTYYNKYFQAWNTPFFGSVYGRISIFDLINRW